MRSTRFPGGHRLNPALKEWERIYNTVRPHQSLGYRTPLEFVKRLAQDSRKEAGVTNVLNQYTDLAAAGGLAYIRDRHARSQRLACAPGVRQWMPPPATSCSLVPPEPPARRFQFGADRPIGPGAPATGVPHASRKERLRVRRGRRTVALHRRKTWGPVVQNGRREVRPGLYPVVLAGGAPPTGSQAPRGRLRLRCLHHPGDGWRDPRCRDLRHLTVGGLLAHRHGNPVAGTGIDSGNPYRPGVPYHRRGQYWTSDWGNAGVDGCPIAQLQGDGTLRAHGRPDHSGGGRGTSSHGGLRAPFGRSRRDAAVLQPAWPPPGM